MGPMKSPHPVQTPATAKPYLGDTVDESQSAYSTEGFQKQATWAHGTLSCPRHSLPHLFMFLLNSLHICLSIFISEIQVSFQGRPFPLLQMVRLMAIYCLWSHFNVHRTLGCMTPADLRFHMVHQRKYDPM